MTPNAYKSLFLLGVKVHAVTLVVTAACVYGLANGGGCANVKGADTSKRTDYSKTAVVASTQASADRQASTHTSGGEFHQAENAADITVTPAEVRVKVTDRADTTKQPTVIAVERDRTAQTIKTDARATTQSSDDIRTGPTFSGPFEGMMSVDGLTVKSVESTFKRRWPIFVGLLIAGLWLEFAPLYLGGNKLAGVGFLAGSAASLVLSDAWLIVICAAAVLFAAWPLIRNSRVLGRLTEVVDDWKQGMPPAERDAFNASLANATAGASAVVDKIRAERKHGGATIKAADYVDPVVVVTTAEAGAAGAA